MFDKFEDQSILKADEIVANPEIVEKIRGRYQMIFQTLSELSMKGMPHNLNRAIKIRGESGWRVVAFAADYEVKVTMFFVIMERVEKG
ncbi:MAG: hypothetical protein V1857_03940 [archaeon]